MPALTSRLTNKPFDRISRKAVQWGISPSWVGYRWVEKETVPEYLYRKGMLHEKGCHGMEAALSPQQASQKKGL
jgi:hypothetical protein